MNNQILAFPADGVLAETVAGQPYLGPAHEAKKRPVKSSSVRYKVLFFIIKPFGLNGLLCRIVCKDNHEILK
jgi:hypothetical protein